jgi:hypothetical protein
MKRLCIVTIATIITTIISLSAWCQVNVKVVNTPASPVPVAIQHNLDHDGTFFAVGPGGSPTLVVPLGVVLTDAHVSFSVPEAIPNAASLFIEDGSGKILVYRVSLTTPSTRESIWPVVYPAPAAELRYS